MKKVTNTLKKLWQDESAQGATEYILLLVIVVAIVLLFKDKIMGTVKSKLGDLDTGIQSVNSNF
ncbi:MAG: hypothetical protein KDD58_02890 [Bdellovibrionales bacterium]|nr:hypothetical protein [Bdellovibrionales bacterium]